MTQRNQRFYTTCYVSKDWKKQKLLCLQKEVIIYFEGRRDEAHAKMQRQNVKQSNHETGQSENQKRSN